MPMFENMNNLPNLFASYIFTTSKDSKELEKRLQGKYYKNDRKDKNEDRKEKRF